MIEIHAEGVCLHASENGIAVDGVARTVAEWLDADSEVAQIIARNSISIRTVTDGIHKLGLFSGVDLPEPSTMILSEERG